MPRTTTVNGRTQSVNGRTVGGTGIPDSGTFHDVSPSTPYGIEFNGDGSEVHISDNTDSHLEIWSLSSAYDITTAGSTPSNTVSGVDAGNQIGYNWGDGGGQLYTGSNGGLLKSYPAATPYDPTTLGSATSASPTHSQDIEGVFWKPDGSKVYLVGVTGTGSAFSEHSASTNWDISTLSQNYEITDGSFASMVGTERDVIFKPDGSRCYMVNSQGKLVYADVPKLWDISSITSMTATTNPFPSGTSSDGRCGIKLGYPGKEQAIVSNKVSQRMEYISIADSDL